MERKSCCSGVRCGSTPRVSTITPEKKPMNVNIKKEEQDVKPRTLKKEATAAAAAAAPKETVKVEGKDHAATVKKEEQDVKPQTLKKEVVVHEATAAAAPKGVKVEGKDQAASTETMKKEEPAKVNVGCGGGARGGGGCSSFK